LGLGDGNDRAYPDQVVIPSRDNVARQLSKTLDERFSPVQVRHVSMSKLHTGTCSFFGGTCVQNSPGCSRAYI
jgi:polynucleotide 5'-kinase involved in rRNA processing